MNRHTRRGVSHCMELLYVGVLNGGTPHPQARRHHFSNFCTDAWKSSISCAVGGASLASCASSLAIRRFRSASCSPHGVNMIRTEAVAEIPLRCYSLHLRI
jgi:hypothetical protein